MGSFYRLIILGALLLGVLPATSTASVPPPIMKVAVAGDSIAEGCHGTPGWCTELRGMLAQQGIHVDFSTLASGGKRCTWVAERIVPFLDEARPDILLLNCGTNDDPAERCYGEACTTWAWRVIVEAAVSRGIQVGVALIGYTDPDDYRVIGARPRLEAVNDLLYSQISRFYQPWNLAIANFQVVPGNVEYLPDGVHPLSPLGARTYAEIWLAAMGSRGWAVTWTTPCGMYGRRAGYPVPSYTTCPR